MSPRASKKAKNSTVTKKTFFTGNSSTVSTSNKKPAPSKNSSLKKAIVPFPIFSQKDTESNSTLTNSQLPASIECRDSVVTLLNGTSEMSSAVYDSPSTNMTGSATSHCSE